LARTSALSASIAASVFFLTLSSAWTFDFSSYLAVTSPTELLLLAIASCPTAATLITLFLVFSFSESGTGGIGFPSGPSAFSYYGIASGALVVSIFCPALETSS